MIDAFFIGRKDHDKYRDEPLFTEQIPINNKSDRF